MIRLKNVAKTYGNNNTLVNALKNINLSVLEGDYISISGTSGSGKSTLMNIIGCLDTPSQGNYYLNKIPVHTLNQNDLSNIRNTYIGFVFQSFFLISGLTAIENVTLPLFYSGLANKESNEKATKLLETVGLGNRLHHYPNELSGGQKQRVAIARALINSPKVLLADEPLGNLDTKNAKEIMELFKEMNKNGMTVILITHDEKYANMANKKYTIEDGVLKEA